MKENLLRVKRLLERKCFASNDGSEYGIEAYLDVVGSIDNEGAFNYIQEYINNTIQYCINNGIQYDEIDLYPRFSLYFDSRYEGRYPDTIEKQIKPISDILRVFINAVGCTTNASIKTFDLDDINEDREFIITFDDFKSMLESQGITVSYLSFEDILNDYRNYKPTVCKISKSKDLSKKLIRD